MHSVAALKAIFCNNLGCEFTHLSCRYLSHLANVSEGKIALLRPYSTNEEAVAAVKNGEAWGVVSMTSNFSAALLERMFNALEADADTRNQSKISVSNKKTGFKPVSGPYLSVVVHVDL